MIEGYSVDEAASVLGVPKGRVWELLARGVLAGTPEDGGGMRVYLQGRPMEPIVGRPPESRHGGPGERPAGSNGNGGEHGQPGFEASPFRELLTEFRNLTERYGQALLALGEARGEVASLRTRVELLEARVDLRLPSAPPLVQWSPPAQQQQAPQAEIEPDPTPETTAHEPQAEQSATLEEREPEEAEPAAQAPAEEEPTVKPTRSRRRKRAARLATEGFAEALARAQDPTASDLPGGEETQAAFHELRERIRRESLGGEAPEAAAVADDQPADAMGFADVTAPAQEVELDSFLADEELGGSVEQAPVAEVVVSQEGEPIDELEQPPEAEAFQQSDQTQEAEPIPHLDQVEAAEPMGQLDEIGVPQPVEEGNQVEVAEPVEEGNQVEVEEPVEERNQVGEGDRMEEPEQIQEAAPLQAAEFAEPVDVVEPISPADATAAMVAVEPMPEEPSPSAEPETNAEPTTDVPVYSHEWDEPDWIAEEDVDWTTDESAASSEPVAMGESPEIGWDELPAATARATPEPAAERPMDADPAEGEESEPPTSALTAVETPEPELAAPPTAPPASQPGQVHAVGLSPDSPGPVVPVDASADAPHHENPTATQASEEELMWLGDEFRAGPSTLGSTGRVTTIPMPATTPAVPDVGVSAAEDEALSRLAVERGWDDDELRAIRSLLAQPGRPALAETDLDVPASEAQSPNVEAATERAQEVAEPTAPSVDSEAREEEAFDWEQGPPAWNPPPMARASRELPGAVELDQAMAAFEVGAWSKGSAKRGDQPAEEVKEQAQAERAQGEQHQADQARGRARPASPEPASNGMLEEAAGAQLQEPARHAPRPAPDAPSSVTLPEPSAEGDSDWLRGRRGPAANAYRRLRRLFP